MAKRYKLKKHSCFHFVDSPLFSYSARAKGPTPKRAVRKSCYLGGHKKLSAVGATLIIGIALTALNQSSQSVSTALTHRPFM